MNEVKERRGYKRRGYKRREKRLREDIPGYKSRYENIREEEIRDNGSDCTWLATRSNSMAATRHESNTYTANNTCIIFAFPTGNWSSQPFNIGGSSCILFRPILLVELLKQGNRERDFSHR